MGREIMLNVNKESLVDRYSTPVDSLVSENAELNAAIMGQ